MRHSEAVMPLLCVMVVFLGVGAWWLVLSMPLFSWSREQSKLNRKHNSRIAAAPITRLSDAKEGMVIAVCAQIVDGQSPNAKIAPPHPDDVGIRGLDRRVSSEIVVDVMVLEDDSGRRVLVADKSAESWRQVGESVFAIGRLERHAAGGAFRSKEELDMLVPEAEGCNVIIGVTKDHALRPVDTWREYKTIAPGLIFLGVALALFVIVLLI